MKIKLGVVFHIIYAVFFAYVLCNVFVAYTANHDILYIILGTAVLIFLTAGAAFMFRSKIPVFSDKTVNIVYICISLVMLAVQFYLITQLKTVQNADAYAVFKAAKNYAESGSWDNMYKDIEKITHYFDRYPNNWCILAMLGWFYRIIYLIIGRVPVIASLILNVFMLQIGNYFFYKISRLIFKSNSKVLLCLALMFTCAPLYTYSAFVYTDSFSLPFVMGAVYFIIKTAMAQSKKQMAVYISAASVLIAVGYSVKGSAAILIVSGIIYLFLFRGWKRAAVCGIACVLGFVLINKVLLFSYASHSGMMDKENFDSYHFPSTHYVMMGLMGDGRFNENARRFTYKQPNFEAKKEANIKEIKRLLKQPASVLADHFNKKVQLTWSDGRYRVMHYLAKSRSCSAKYMITHGNKFYGYSQTYHMTMLLAMFVSIIAGIIKKDKSHMLMVRLSVFGLSVFLLIWETTPRYLFNFLPLFLLMETDGIFRLFKLFKRFFLKSSLKPEEAIKTV